MTDKTTRRVRILVVMDPDGKWEASGSHSFSDAYTRHNLNDLAGIDDLAGGLSAAPWRYTWVEADVPLPVKVAESVTEGVVQDDT